MCQPVFGLFLCNENDYILYNKVAKCVSVFPVRSHKQMDRFQYLYLFISGFRLFETEGGVGEEVELEQNWMI